MDPNQSAPLVVGESHWYHVVGTGRFPSFAELLFGMRRMQMCLDMSNGEYSQCGQFGKAHFRCSVTQCPFEMQALFYPGEPGRMAGYDLFQQLPNVHNHQTSGTTAQTPNFHTASLSGVPNAQTFNVINAVVSPSATNYLQSHQPIQLFLPQQAIMAISNQQQQGAPQLTSIGALTGGVPPQQQLEANVDPPMPSKGVPLGIVLTRKGVLELCYRMEVVEYQPNKFKCRSPQCPYLVQAVRTPHAKEGYRLYGHSQHNHQGAVDVCQLRAEELAKKEAKKSSGSNLPQTEELLIAQQVVANAEHIHILAGKERTNTTGGVGDSTEAGKTALQQVPIAPLPNGVQNSDVIFLDDLIRNKWLPRSGLTTAKTEQDNEIDLAADAEENGHEAEDNKELATQQVQDEPKNDALNEAVKVRRESKEEATAVVKSNKIAKVVVALKGYAAGEAKGHSAAGESLFRQFNAEQLASLAHCIKQSAVYAAAASKKLVAPPPAKDCTSSAGGRTVPLSPAPLRSTDTLFSLDDCEFKSVCHLRRLTIKRGDNGLLFMPPRESQAHVEGLLLALSERNDHIRVDEYRGGKMDHKALERWPKQKGKAAFEQRVARKFAQFFSDKC